MTDHDRRDQSPAVIHGSRSPRSLCSSPSSVPRVSQIGRRSPRRRHFEYVHQEVLANALTQSLNDLDGQGWEVFQVVPIWQIKNDNAETILAPRAYELFGRASINPK